MDNIINTLIKIRTDNAMTQKDFGLECGLSKSVISQYEQGTRNPSKKALYAICNRFEIDPTQFGLPKISPYLKGNKDVTKENNMNDRVVENLLNQIDIKDEKLNDYKRYQKAEMMQRAVDESVGFTTWVFQAELRRQGLMFERRLTDIGNGEHIFMKVLGYNNEETLMFLSDEWIPAIPYSREDYPQYKVISPDTYTQLYRIFTKLPSLIKGLLQGSYIIRIPFEFIKKNGEKISALVSHDLDFQTLTITVTCYFNTTNELD